MSHTEHAPGRAGELGVLNDSEFAVIGEHELRRARRDGEFVSVLWLRVDRRGPISLEVAEVERPALRALGELVALELRASDVVALVGEADLAVLLPDTDPAQLAVVLEHLRVGVFELAESGRTGLIVRAGSASADPAADEESLAALMATAAGRLGWVLQGG
jgi:GGDEF domain-containing protein